MGGVTSTKCRRRNLINNDWVIESFVILDVCFPDYFFGSSVPVLAAPTENRGKVQLKINEPQRDINDLCPRIIHEMILTMLNYLNDDPPSREDKDDLLWALSHYHGKV